MIFVLLIGLILSTNSFDLLVNESNCVYDRVYSDTFTSNGVICLIRCAFKSIKTRTNGGAIIISLKNNFGTQNYIDNCIFTQCFSKEGGAIYFNIDKKASTKIINSVFSKNYAILTSGGIFFNSIYEINKIQNDFQVQNCTFESNIGHKKGGFIYYNNLNSSFENCIFSDNNLSSNGEDAKGGSVYSAYSQALFVNCTFSNNNAISTDNSYGGAIYLSNAQLKGSFIECTFKNNTSYSYVHSTYGGAISYVNYPRNLFQMNESIIKCYFYNNTSYSKYTKAFGGAISSIIDLSEKSFEKMNTTISDVIFINNSAISYEGSFGGTFFYGYEGIKFDTINITAIYIFKNVQFNNNRAISYSSSNGGAVSHSPLMNIEFLKYPETHFINSSFTNNTAYSSSIEAILMSLGGAIHLNMTNGFIQNCTFKKNVAETFLKSFLIRYKEPQIFGGSVYILHTLHSVFNISDCLFLNNCGIGKSPKYISTGKGGAIYCSNTSISIFKSNFINNTQIHYGNKFDIDCSIEGGAFYSTNINTKFVDCVFENNKAMLDESVKSSFLLTKIKGGAIMGKIKLLLNCKFKENLVLIHNRKENEFGGSIYLEAGNITGCTFDNNIAYNGCDICFCQNLYEKLTMNECIFKHDIVKNFNIKSLFYFTSINNNNTLIYDFNNNKIFSGIHTFMFDGKMDKEFVILKSNFQNNCILPYNKDKFKNDKIYFYDSKMNQISFEEAFKSNCMIESNSESIPIITFIQPMTHVPNSIDSYNRKINRIFNLLMTILVSQVIIILLIISITIFVLLKNNNQQDLIHLIDDTTYQI